MGALGPFELNHVHLGDCTELLKQMPRACVDAVVTDPPYELGFAGKAWDSSGISFRPLVWSAVRRVAKPGAHMLAFGGCYDAETEVLTRRGWVAFPDVGVQDDFASIDPDTGMVEFQRPNSVIRFVHDGPMHHYHTNRVDLLVTPDHKVLVAPLGRAPEGHWRLVPSGRVSAASRMTKTSNGRVDAHQEPFVLPGAVRGKNRRGGGRKDLPGLTIQPEVWAAFLGLWLAEGHASKTPSRRGGYSTHVAVTHFDRNNISEMAAMLSPYFNVRLYPDSGRLRINDPRLWACLAPLGQAPTKRIPAYVKTWPMHLLRVLLDWYARGDGDDEGRIYTASKGLADDVQEVAMYAGFAADVSVRPIRAPVYSKKLRKTITARHPSYVIRLLKAQTRPEIYARHGSVVRTTVSREDWGAREVFCVELPRHHTLYVRRKGKAVWCGNSRTFHRIAVAIEDAGWEIRDVIMWLYSSGMPKSMEAGKLIDKAAGVEREVVGTVVKTCDIFSGTREREVDVTLPATNAAKKWQGWGTTLRPAYEPIIVARNPFEGTIADNVLRRGTGVLNIDGCRIQTSGESAGGRFPANVIHDGSAEVLDAFPIASEDQLRPGAYLGGAGSAARFFYCCKAEREEFNDHCTVKPLSLMRYLCKLVTPVGGVVLDPFSGSGSTGVAALQQGFNFIGTEKDPHYAKDICNPRLEAVLKRRKT